MPVLRTYRVVGNEDVCNFKNNERKGTKISQLYAKLCLIRVEFVFISNYQDGSNNQQIKPSLQYVEKL